MHALIQNDQIVQIGHLPRIWWDGTRWHDLRDDDGTYAAELGWLPIQMDPRPADTDTETHDSSYELIDGQPVQVWTPRAWTDDELAERMEVRARLDSHDERLARIEAKLWPADPDPDPDAPIEAPTWDDYGGIWPNGQLLSDGGTTWRNTSGVPLTSPPSGFPGQPSQWTHLFVEVTTADPDPDPGPDGPEGYIGPWSELVNYVVGDIVSRNGRYWKCEISHGPEQQGQWSPGEAHTVWTDIGLVTSA